MLIKRRIKREENKQAMAARSVETESEMECNMLYKGMNL